MSLLKIYADFGNADSVGRLRLTTQGSLTDIKRQNIKPANGMKIVVYDEELSASGEVLFSDEEKIWVAKIDREKIERQPKV